MNKLSILILLLGAIYDCSTVTAAASWSASTSMTAGEFKAVNLAPTMPGTTTPPQNYSNVLTTPFTSVPRVILGLEGYSQNAPANPASTQLGWKITINTITTTGYTTTLTIYGSLIYNLVFIYFAIETDPLLPYFTSSTFLTFNGSNPQFNTSLLPRSSSFSLPNPMGATSGSSCIIQAYLSSFGLIPGVGGSILVSINASYLNSTHYSATIGTSTTGILSEISFYTLLLDPATIMTTTYIHILDVGWFSLAGTVNTFSPSTYTDYPNQFQYRNNIWGLHHIDYPTGNVSFYLNNTSGPLPYLLLFINIEHRVRSCTNSSIPYYYHTTQLCYDICPNNTSPNTTYNYCFTCDASCLSCSLPNSNTSCLSCVVGDHRVLSNGSCVCMPNYFQNVSSSTSTCSACHPSCLTCSDSSSTSCLSCNSSLSRYLSNTTCACSEMFYDNVTCMGCMAYCVDCTYDGLNAICNTCNASLSRTVNTTNNNQTCICMDGYYEEVDNTCVKCGMGCLMCERNTNGSTSTNSVCSMCDSANLFILAGTECICQSGILPPSGICTSTCGDGIITGDEQCDDGNTADADGCNSVCRVQVDCTCMPRNSTTSNASNPTSLCYYVTPIQMEIVLLEKVQYHNQVRATIKITAPNCNTAFLSEYLTASPSLTLEDSARLLSRQGSIRQLLSNQPTPTPRALSSSVMTIDSISFDAGTSLLDILFSYSATIDLSMKSVKFTPSVNTANPSLQYFYSTPATTLAFGDTYNNLPTIYYDQSQYKGVRIVGVMFIIVVALYGVLIVGLLIYLQGAMAVQSLLTFQVIYFSTLLQSPIREGIIGIISAGCYSYGYNPHLLPTIPIPKLFALSIDGNGFNNTLLSLSILVILILIYSTGFIIQKYRNRSRKEGEGQHTQYNAQHNTYNNNTQPLLSRRPLQYVLEIGLTLQYALLFISTIPIAYMSQWILIPCVITLLLSIPSMLFMYKCSSCSFKCISTGSNQQQPIIQHVRRYHYAILLILTIAGGLLIGGLSKMNKSATYVGYVLITLGCIGMCIWIGLKRVFNNSWDNRRNIINCIVVALAMIVWMLANAVVGDGTGIGIGITIVVILLLHLISTTSICIRTIYLQYRKINGLKLYEMQMKEMKNELTNIAPAFSPIIGEGDNTRRLINPSIEVEGGKEMGQMGQNKGKNKGKNNGNNNNEHNEHNYNSVTNQEQYYSTVKKEVNMNKINEVNRTLKEFKETIKKEIKIERDDASSRVMQISMEGSINLQSILADITTPGGQSI